MNATLPSPIRVRGRWLTALTLVLATWTWTCTRGDGGAHVRQPVMDAARTFPQAAAHDVPVAGDSSPRRQGLTHEELMRFYYVDGGGADASDEVAESGRPIAADGEFSGEAPTAIVRARYAITLPDERATLVTERALRVDDQGDRASLMVVGTGLPSVPGMRVMARAGLTGFALVSPEGGRYRAVTPDELQTWFLGASSRAGTTLGFRRSDSTVIAARGGLTLVIATEREGPLRPLTCRALVAMFLGGDAAAARVGCAGARMPVRVGLYARGWRSLALERAEFAEVRVPRASLAVPPLGASADLAPPVRASEGAFFAPSELARLGGVREPRHTLTVHNALGREALVFVDDLAIGWIAAGAEATFVGLSAGQHVVRGRSLDGYERSRSTSVTFPATVRLENAPQLAR